MREIEFRVWHIKDKKYYEVYSISSCGRGLKVEYVKERYLGIPDIATIYELESPYEEYEEPYETPFILEQFTGLRDCKRTKEFPNGQKIFEGDVIKGHCDEYLCLISGAVVEYCEEIGAYVAVEYGIDGKEIDYHDNHDTWECKDIEVIGNIHEVKE